MYKAGDRNVHGERNVAPRILKLMKWDAEDEALYRMVCYHAQSWIWIRLYQTWVSSI